jgi:hypothetical protein
MSTDGIANHANSEGNCVAVEEPGSEIPSGQVSPDLSMNGVTEIRIHGVGGSTPESILGDPSPQQVAGDRIARFYRTVDPHGRHLESYSWGGENISQPAASVPAVTTPLHAFHLAGWMAPSNTVPSPAPHRQNDRRHPNQPPPPLGGRLARSPRACTHHQVHLQIRSGAWIRGHAAAGLRRQAAARQRASLGF